MLIAVLAAYVMTSGLLAGFFFAYWCSVMIGLRAVDNRVFVETMQAINAALPNGRFVVPFFTPAVLAPISAWLAFADGSDASGWWSVGATVLSLVTLAITITRNVPMNNALAAAGDPESLDSAQLARGSFEAPWTRWNDVRTYTSALAFAAGVGALAVL